MRLAKGSVQYWPEWEASFSQIQDECSFLKSNLRTMGLSIHYSGKLANPELLSELIEDIEEICKVYGWPYQIFERQFPPTLFGKTRYNDEIYGIWFTPKECETIPVCFLSNGRMSDLMHLNFWGRSKDPKERKYLYMLSVKTQFAGVETHCFIIHLFRYLSKKYFVDFKMTDEGNYWETNDKQVLEFNFKKYNLLLNAFSTAIQNYPLLEGEDIEAYVMRLIKHIGKK